MPTGYTAEIMKNEDYTFEEYARNCARAFGSTILQRDDPSRDFDIEKCMESSDYSRNALIEDTSLDGELELLTASGWKKRLTDHKKDRTAICVGYIEKSDLEIGRLERMLKSALGFIPPTPEHASFFKFMITQISDTIQFDDMRDHYKKEIKELVDLTLLDFKTAEKAKVKRDIAYHTNEIDEESRRNVDRRKWLIALEKAIKETPNPEQG